MVYNMFVSEGSFVCLMLFYILIKEEEVVGEEDVDFWLDMGFKMKIIYFFLFVLEK